MDDNFYSQYSDDSTSKRKSIAISDTSIAFVKAYLWMFVGVFITFIVGLISTKVLANFIISNDSAGLSVFLFVAIFSAIAQFILCYTINKDALYRTNFAKALAGFIVFSILNGISFSSFFIFFDVSVLYQVFGMVTIYYLLLTAISFLFRNKIHKLSTFALVGLFTLLISSAIVSIYSLVFFNASSSISSQLFLAISILGLIVFTILTLVDIKSMYRLIDYSEDKKCSAIATALSLYLDFINILIYVLRILLIIGKNAKRK